MPDYEKDFPSNRVPALPGDVHGSYKGAASFPLATPRDVPRGASSVAPRVPAFPAVVVVPEDLEGSGSALSDLVRGGVKNLASRRFLHNLIHDFSGKQDNPGLEAGAISVLLRGALVEALNGVDKEHLPDTRPVPATAEATAKRDAALMAIEKELGLGAKELMAVLGMTKQRLQRAIEHPENNGDRG